MCNFYSVHVYNLLWWCVFGISICYTERRVYLLTWADLKKIVFKVSVISSFCVVRHSQYVLCILIEIQRFFKNVELSKYMLLQHLSFPITTNEANWFKYYILNAYELEIFKYIILVAFELTLATESEFNVSLNHVMYEVIWKCH